MYIIYNTYSDIWEELLATLEEIRCKTDDEKNIIKFLKSYCNVLLEHCRSKEESDVHATHDYEAMYHALRARIREIYRNSEEQEDDAQIETHYQSDILLKYCTRLEMEYKRGGEE